MKVYKIIPVLVVYTVFMIVFTANAYCQDSPETQKPETQKPGNPEIRDVFQPGLGLAVGEIELVQGTALIFHENEDFAYRAAKSLPLFKGDTIETKEKGLLRFKLNDESIMTLASNTKLVLNRSVHDPDKETRSTFISMGLGKARFKVIKLLNFINSKFNVKTKTAIVGVRGSDFIIISTPDKTEVTALDKTSLQVLSLIAPEAKTMLKEFENTIVRQNELPTIPELLMHEKIELIKEPFRPGTDKLDAKPGDMTDNVSIRDNGVLVSKNVLVTPESMGISETNKIIELVDLKKGNNIQENLEENDAEEIINQEQEKIIEQQQEELRRFEFPAIPR